MPRTSLLVVAMLFSSFAAPALAQSPINPSGSPEADQFHLRPYPEVKSTLQNGEQQQENDPMARIHVDQYLYRPAKNQTESRVLILPEQSLSDATCYSIRSYLVVRDSPHSDSTHRDGSTTCVPAARFRVHTAEDHQR